MLLYKATLKERNKYVCKFEKRRESYFSKSKNACTTSDKIVQKCLKCPYFSEMVYCLQLGPSFYDFTCESFTLAKSVKSKNSSKTEPFKN